MVHGAKSMKDKFLHWLMRNKDHQKIYDQMIEPMVEGIQHIREYAKVKYIPGLEVKCTAMLNRLEKELEK